MAAINSPVSTGTTTNNYVIQIPVITQIPCQLSVLIYRKSVYRNENGNPFPVMVTNDLNHSTIVKIITPNDDSTRIKISVKINSRSFDSEPLALDGRNPFTGIKVLTINDVRLIKDRPLTKEESAQFDRSTTTDTVDPDDVCTADPIDPKKEEQTKQKVRAVLNRTPFAIDTLEAAVSPISRVGSPKDVSANIRRTTVSNIASNSTLSSPKTTSRIPSIFNFGIVNSPKGKNTLASPKNNNLGAGASVTVSSPKHKNPASPKKAPVTSPSFNLGSSGSPNGKLSLTSPKKNKLVAGGGFY